MAAFDTGKMPPKSTVQFITTACALYCILLTATIGLSLTTKFPFDLVGKPLTSVQIIATVTGIAYVAVAAVSSARFSGKNLVKCCFLVGLSSVGYHCICILFGAPVIESSRETFHFAMLLSTLTVVPLCCLYGCDTSKWAKLYASSRTAVGAEVAVYFTSVCTLAGAWLGAIPIPLDWDRPWQVWPVSCVLGALFGYCIGLLIAAIYIPYQYKQLYKMKLI